MNFLNIFEDRIAGVFGPGQAPFSFKKLAKQAAREMESQTLVINGANTAPALYTILIAADDDAFMAPYYPQLARETSEFVKAQAEKKGYAFVGAPLVRFMIDPSLKPGKFSVFAENVDHPTLARLYEEERAFYQGVEPEPMGAARSRQGAAPAANQGDSLMGAANQGARAPQGAHAPQSARGSQDPFAPANATPGGAAPAAAG